VEGLNRLSVAVDNLAAWLFLSGRINGEEDELKGLVNPSTSTPCSLLANQATNNLLQIFELFSQDHKNSKVIKLAIKATT